MSSPIEEPDMETVHELGRIFSLPPGRARNIGIHLQTAILEHRLKPGTKLSEDEVGEIFGVSRTVVRMALQALAHSKLVTIERNRGAFVSKPSVKDANEVFEARALIEPRIVHMAANHAVASDIAYLRAHIEAEHQALNSGDLGKALALSGLFHIAISDIADQQVLGTFLRSLISRSSLIIALYWKRPDTTCESRSHGALIDALEAKDPQAAEEIMKTHIADLHSGLDLTEKHVIELPLANILGLKKESFSE
jgi:DNA-binding GntR family transcriptional regulator